MVHAKSTNILWLLGFSACATDYGANDPTVGGWEERQAALGSAEYGPANWIKSPNYQTGNRKPGQGQVTVIVVHTTQGSYNGTLSWFQNTSAKVSSHYVVSKTGAVTQMVMEKDIGWHVGSANGYTIGIEQEGFVADPNWITPQLFDASVKLTCYLVKKWGLPPDGAHIKGHVQLPNQTHTDPGKYWDYAKYNAEVAACVNGQPPPLPGPVGCCGVKIPVSGNAVIDDAGNDCIQLLGPSDSWWTGAVAGSNGGSVHYTYTSTKGVAENAARWRLTFDKPGKYKVEAFAPSNFATAKPAYTIRHAGQDSSVVVDQKPLSNVWVDLGTYDFAGNCDEFVSAGDNTGQAYDKNVMLGIDAVRVSAVAPPCAGSCDDANPCTDDSCQGGNCTHGPNAANCSDGDACTTGDKCSGGTCATGNTVKDCNDNNACTDDACTAGTCSHASNGAGCDDGDACTETDHCQGGKCLTVPKKCDDGDLCNGSETCAGGKCQPGNGANCDDGNPCTKDSCLGGACKHEASAAPCDDGNGCTVGDSCAGGSCQAGLAKLCDDGNPCTKDACTSGTCVTSGLTGACDDGDGCTEGDYCAQGNCLSGALKTCDDGLACTQDSCLDGQCAHVGAVKPLVKTCAGLDVSATDPCGGPDQIQACPGHQPCLDGVCGGAQADASETGKTDAGETDGESAADAGRLDGAGDGLSGDGVLSDAKASFQAPVAKTPGCSASSNGTPGAAALLLASLAGLLWWRRRARLTAQAGSRG